MEFCTILAPPTSASSQSSVAIFFRIGLPIGKAWVCLSPSQTGCSCSAAPFFSREGCYCREHRTCCSERKHRRSQYPLEQTLQVRRLEKDQQSACQTERQHWTPGHKVIFLMKDKCALR